MSGSVVCTTEYIDSCTHFCLTPNIPGSVEAHVLCTIRASEGCKVALLTLCTVQLQGKKPVVTFFRSVSVGVCLRLCSPELN